MALVSTSITCNHRSRPVRPHIPKSTRRLPKLHLIIQVINHFDRSHWHSTTIIIYNCGSHIPKSWLIDRVWSYIFTYILQLPLQPASIKNATVTAIPSFHCVRRQCSHRRRSSASHWCSTLYATEAKTYSLPMTSCAFSVNNSSSERIGWNTSRVYRYPS